MNKRFIVMAFGLFGFLLPLFSQQPVTLGSLLKEMADFDAVTRFPSPAYTLLQTSSYDRRSVSPDESGWFANGDFNQFIREEKKQNRTEYVMMDADGPGAVVRFWLTTVVKPGIMRFYFDNETAPAIVVPAFDLMKGGLNLSSGLLNPHSSYEANGKGGNTLYLPLPYQKHCKITWEYTDTSAKKTAHYYQINYRTYAPGTKVETFTRGQITRYKAVIDETEAALWNPGITSGKKSVSKQTITAGKQVAIVLPEGANAIRMLKIGLSTPMKEDYERIWRSVMLSIEFDGEQTVLCPLGDFIGSGYGGRKIKSWYRELSDDGQLTSRWVMPYQRNARISVINNSPVDVAVDAVVTTGSYNWDNRSMYFHTTYKYEKDVKDVKGDYDLSKVAKNDTAAPIDWNFVSIAGKGVYMGNTLAVDNHMDAWYGEGDAKLYVDNEVFPSEFGTGLEDYYNTSWAPVVLYQTPFANAPRADEPSSFGHNTFTRTRILDAVPFNKAFVYDMEMLSWKGGTIDAAVATYWYGFKGSQTSMHEKQ